MEADEEREVGEAEVSLFKVVDVDFMAKLIVDTGGNGVDSNRSMPSILIFDV